MDATPSTSGRADGRGLEEFRTAFIKTQVISQARGSAYAEFGSTKLMVGVYGPRQSEVRLGFTDTGRLNCEVKLTTFASHRLSKTELGQAEAAMAAALQQALEASVQLDKFPKAVFDVYALVLELGGSDTAVAVTAASVALADAGVELLDLVPAAHVVKLHGGQMLLDPTLAESQARGGGGGTDGAAGGAGGGPGSACSVTLALMPSLDEVTLLSVQGCWSGPEMRDALELCMGGCGQLKALMRDTLLAAA